MTDPDRGHFIDFCGPGGNRFVVANNQIIVVKIQVADVLQDSKNVIGGCGLEE